MRFEILAVVLLLLSQVGSIGTLQAEHTPIFDGDDAYNYLVAQCDFGTRPPGSDNLSMCRNYIVNELSNSGWQSTLQNFTYLGVECVNIIARWNTSTVDSIILGAHYDTRPHADHDPNPGNRNTPIIGANDGASGVALLLELANILPDPVRSEVELVFFDAEDSGGIDGWDWIVGSTHYVDELPPSRIGEISAMILLDMIGDENLILKRETTSTQSLQDTVWEVAAGLGYDNVFVETLGGSILDDHRPFLSAGIPALDIIQNAPFPSTWHTLADVPENCAADSLEIVGSVVEVFLVNQVGSDSTYTPDGFDPFILLYLLPPLALIAVLIILRRK